MAAPQYNPVRPRGETRGLKGKTVGKGDVFDAFAPVAAFFFKCAANFGRVHHEASGE